MTGAFAGRNVGEVFPVVSAVAKLICEDGKAYAAYVHEALLDSNPNQKESLLSVHQSLRDQRNGIDDRARCERGVDGNPGLQMARFGKSRLPFWLDFILGGALWHEWTRTDGNDAWALRQIVWLIRLCLRPHNWSQRLNRKRGKSCVITFRRGSLSLKCVASMTRATLIRFSRRSRRCEVLLVGISFVSDELGWMLCI
jgi:hypothetical protein